MSDPALGLLMLGLIVVAAIGMGLVSAAFTRPMLVAAARSATGGTPAIS